MIYMRGLLQLRNHRFFPEDKNSSRKKAEYSYSASSNLTDNTQCAREYRNGIENIFTVHPVVRIAHVYKTQKKSLNNRRISLKRDAKL